VGGIKDEEKWMMDLHKRYFDKMHTKDLILKLINVIDMQKVVKKS
jgi:ribosomal protein S10